jgi:hypothetical protein
MVVNSPTLTDLDSDSDGLKDWEENLYRTDPHKPDTDGDETPDGEEIKLGRDPTKKGPNDKLAIQEKVALQADETYNTLKQIAEGGNLTQAIISQLLNTQGPEALLKPQNAEETADTIAAYLDKFKISTDFTPSEIPDADLIIINDARPSSIKQYFNTIAELYEKHIIPLSEDDVVILINALNKQEKIDPKTLAIPISAITALIEKIKKTPAPEPLIILHKKELFYAEKTIAELELLKHADTEDSLFLAMLINMRMELKKKIGALHREEIPRWLKERGIVFSTQDKALLLYGQ